jgi:hypothetical protein
VRIAERSTDPCSPVAHAWAESRHRQRNVGKCSRQAGNDSLRIALFHFSEELTYFGGYFQCPFAVGAPGLHAHAPDDQGRMRRRGAPRPRRPRSSRVRPRVFRGGASCAPDSRPLAIRGEDARGDLGALEQQMSVSHLADCLYAHRAWHRLLPQQSSQQTQSIRHNDRLRTNRSQPFGPAIGADWREGLFVAV